VGRFRSLVRVPGEEEPREILHGATILATGGSEAVPREYGYGECDAVLTQGELERALADSDIDPAGLETVVMIQCVGSRERGGREYCSRICCAAALKNALRILDANPEARILVLYRDMMTYGFRERFYTEARERGVLFATYDIEGKPVVEIEDGAPIVRYLDQVLDREIRVTPDLLVLSPGMVPSDGTELAERLGIKLTPDGFFEEADYKFRPVETLREGVYVCGLAHSPRSISESLAMAEAAAQRALTVLSQRELTTARLVSGVRPTLCATCGVCVDLCPYEARSFDDSGDRIVVDELACQGCGICVAACPSGAASFAGLAERQVMATLDVQLSELALP
jgi:heterodisulfide reductase subunit A